MTRERAKELMPLIQAYAEGKSLQAKNAIMSTWKDIDAPFWSEGVEYRIKPEPREFWLIQLPMDVRSGHIVCSSEEAANAYASTFDEDASQIIHVKEVL